MPRANLVRMENRKLPWRSFGFMQRPARVVCPCSESMPLPEERKKKTEKKNPQQNKEDPKRPLTLITESLVLTQLVFKVTTTERYRASKTHRKREKKWKGRKKKKKKKKEKKNHTCFFHSFVEGDCLENVCTCETSITSLGWMSSPQLEMFQWQGVNSLPWTTGRDAVSGWWLGWHLCFFSSVSPSLLLSFFG